MRLQLTEEAVGFLEQQGYTACMPRKTPRRARPLPPRAPKGQGAKAAAESRRILARWCRTGFRFAGAERERVMEALDTALRMGAGHLAVYAMDADGGNAHVWKYSDRLHCADCDIEYTDPLPSSFSFNSPLGACEACRGFGRVIGIDFGLVIPDENKTLLEGAIKPWTTPSYKECQDELQKYAPKAGVPLGVPWNKMSEEHKRWVLYGTPDWKGGSDAWKHQWYGVQRFFDWLETKAYKMHVRVLLSKYRSYTPCPTCNGARLKPDALLWRLGTKEEADTVLPPEDGRYRRFMPVGANWSREQLYGLGGLSIHDVMLLPIERVRRFFDTLSFSGALDAATDLLMTEVRARLKFLCDVGLGYLTLDRQSRTLSGGEVQRINLTTALGTSLVNTLFVLDEPSIGLHPRDMHRVVEVMHRLRNAGNTLVVVEHDPQVMVAADRIIDIGPGPGERGGQIVFDGTPAQLRAARTLTGDYLGGRQRVEAPRPMPVAANTPRLLLEGVSAHNLKNVSVELPLGRLVCVTGVSGSGKSTLVQDVLFPALLKQKGKPSEAAGAFERLLGAEQIAEVVMVDQTPIGKTARSNPASYVGAFDPIRKLFAQAPLARERAYTAGTFSFNGGDGRCPTCGGTGFEHVEMQFRVRRYCAARANCDGAAFPPRSAGSPRRAPGQERLHRRSAGNDRQRGAGLLQGPARCANRPGAAGRCGPQEYVRGAQPAPTPSGGEGAAAQARGPPGRGGAQRHLDRQGRQEGQPVPVRRAHHRPALRRRGAPDARLPQTAGRGPHPAGQRTQP